MLVGNKDCSSKSRVKFVSYTGAFPNLCSGRLCLNINGEDYYFGYDYSIPDDWKHTEYNGRPLYPSFWSSGGSCYFTGGYIDEHVEQGEWQINVDDLPEWLQKYAAEIDEVFNASVPHGCCGGCL